MVHNDPGIKINLQQISALKHKIGIENIQVIIGMVKDIDIDKMLSLHQEFTNIIVPMPNSQGSYPMLT